MRVSVIGSGYVGLVTGACLADIGHNVICMDNDKAKIESLKLFKLPIYEPGLEELIITNCIEKRLIFTDDIKEAVLHGEIIFVTVGTPSKEDGSCDLSYIEEVAKGIAPHLSREYKLIVEKSTVPVKTGEWLNKIIKENASKDANFEVASNPEFLKEGSAIQDFVNPDRIVIGVNSEKAANYLVKLYMPLNAPILVTDINSAELIKHASNAFLALKISYINAIANICERSGADVKKVAKGIGMDKRIGMDFLEAGCGFGGSCFPKDLLAFISIAKELGYEFSLLEDVYAINEAQRISPVKKLKRIYGSLEGKIVGLLGLSFKPNTDDMRESPAIYIANLLNREGAFVRAYDPIAIEKARDVLSKVEFLNSPYDVANGADAIILVTEWREFRYMNLLRIKELMRNPVFIDGRNIFDPEKMKKLGFIYEGIGRR